MVPLPHLFDLDREHSSLAVLTTLGALAFSGYIFYHIGVIGWMVRRLGRLVRKSVRTGFRVWESLFSWAPWWVVLLLVVGLLGTGEAVLEDYPWITLLLATVPSFLGVSACLAYMYIDLERYEVERGHKAVHNPLKGQALAVHLVRHGSRVGVLLLAAATMGMIGGFALINQALYETIGQRWYTVGTEGGHATYLDFLAYALVNLLRVVDVLDVATSRQLFRVTLVKQTAWPANVLLMSFKTFFTLILLQQIFASLRQGRLLAETVADFWSPHEPIHERARAALPQYGPSVIGPLLVSLRAVSALTKEQRDQLPAIIAAIGPAAVPTLRQHLSDPHEHVRAVAASALGQMGALEATAALASLTSEPSDMVRASAVSALGELFATKRLASPGKNPRSSGVKTALFRRWWIRDREPVTPPLSQGLLALESALGDPAAIVRIQSAAALGQIGADALPVLPRLLSLLTDGDETVRCQVLEALASVGVGHPEVISPLTQLLSDASVSVRTTTCRTLAGIKTDLSDAVPALVGLLQDRDEAVRTAAAEALAQAGPLDALASAPLTAGLANPDNVIRAQTAEALGTIGAPAQDVAPALVEVLNDSNDVVRAKAVEALGKMGEASANVAIPGLMRALRDPDSWVSALAAEALGQLGEAADEAIPALVRSLGHVNAQVRANAAEALGRMGSLPGTARQALERAADDDDEAVRAHALRALARVSDPTVSARRTVRGHLQDASSTVRAAAIEALGLWSDTEALAELLPLLQDPNDDVKVQVLRILPKLTPATGEIVEVLCQRLREEDSPWVQLHAAQTLGKWGTAAASAGSTLLWAVQTAEVGVREESVRAIALIQPPETTQAFAVGLQDDSPDVRIIASAGWMKASAVPEEVVPALIIALRDPETQVRANAANALSRFEELPPDAIPSLVECASHSHEGLRLNAALALRRAPLTTVGATMTLLLKDANPRLRLLAASMLLTGESEHPQALAVVADSLVDPMARLRRATLELIQTLRERARPLRAALEEQIGRESEEDLRYALEQCLALIPSDSPKGQ